VTTIQQIIKTVLHVHGGVRNLTSAEIKSPLFSLVS